MPQVCCEDVFSAGASVRKHNIPNASTCSIARTQRCTHAEDSTNTPHAWMAGVPDSWDTACMVHGRARGCSATHVVHACRQRRYSCGAQRAAHSYRVCRKRGCGAGAVRRTAAQGAQPLQAQTNKYTSDCRPACFKCESMQVKLTRFALPPSQASNSVGKQACRRCVAHVAPKSVSVALLCGS